MSTTLSELLPSLGQSLDGIGFFFGSGASVEAGYPMMAGLTRQVIQRLTPVEKANLDELLAAEGKAYIDATATPNIEELADSTIAHALNSGDARFKALEESLRNHVVQILLDVTNPNLDNHVRFFEALRKRAFGLPCTVWIFTTNYDILLETAASIANVHIENGFSGSMRRFFDMRQLGLVKGTVEGSRFRPEPGVTVKLLKLHGSISWHTVNGALVEEHPSVLAPTSIRSMVLPRRRKVMDTLVPPYDQIFGSAARVIGSECKHIVSCGFSYADEHINQTLLAPSLASGRCRLTALCESEPLGLAQFKGLPTMSAAYQNDSWKSGAAATTGTDLWRFSAFADAF